MIKLQNVTKIYTLSSESEVRAIVAANLEIQRGEFIVITGRSGTGKTTLLNLIAGLTRPTVRCHLTVNVWKHPTPTISVTQPEVCLSFNFSSSLPDCIG
jgi:ABC-type lipoprotein export system ATPase subunit